MDSQPEISPELLPLVDEQAKAHAAMVERNRKIQRAKQLMTAIVPTLEAIASLEGKDLAYTKFKQMLKGTGSFLAIARILKNRDIDRGVQLVGRFKAPN